MSKKVNHRMPKSMATDELLATETALTENDVDLGLQRLQIQLDPSVIAETKIRAVRDRTTASAIVTAALQAYLKL
ncbi:hypothetical protein AB4Y96_13130 [Phyllobacterium sp. TAF24]|uniref:hypothetical protein n=1 Tax=Phyllobacterium sp. TAF24 TaxID=3233068 RepID=UPI003F988DA6